MDYDQDGPIVLFISGAAVIVAAAATVLCLKCRKKQKKKKDKDNVELLKLPPTLSASNQQLRAKIPGDEEHQLLVSHNVTQHGDTHSDKILEDYPSQNNKQVSKITFHDKKDEENEEFPNGPSSSITSKSDPSLGLKPRKEFKDDEECMVNSSSEISMNKECLPSVVLIHESTQQSHYSRSQDLKDSVLVPSEGHDSSSGMNESQTGEYYSRSQDSVLAPSSDKHDSSLGKRVSIENNIPETKPHSFKYIDDSDSLDTNVSGRNGEMKVLKAVTRTDVNTGCHGDFEDREETVLKGDQRETAIKIPRDGVDNGMSFWQRTTSSHSKSMDYTLVDHNNSSQKDRRFNSVPLPNCNLQSENRTNVDFDVTNPKTEFNNGSPGPSPSDSAQEVQDLPHESASTLPSIGPHLRIYSVNRFHENGDAASSVGSIDNLEARSQGDAHTDDESEVKTTGDLSLREDMESVLTENSQTGEVKAETDESHDEPTSIKVEDDSLAAMPEISPMINVTEFIYTNPGRTSPDMEVRGMIPFEEQATMRFQSETHRGQVQHEQSVNKFTVREMDSLGDDHTTILIPTGEDIWEPLTPALSKKLDKNFKLLMKEMGNGIPDYIQSMFKSSRWYKIYINIDAGKLQESKVFMDSRCARFFRTFDKTVIEYVEQTSRPEYLGNDDDKRVHRFHQTRVEITVVFNQNGNGLRGTLTGIVETKKRIDDRYDYCLMTAEHLVREKIHRIILTLLIESKTGMQTEKIPVEVPHKLIGVRDFDFIDPNGEEKIVDAVLIPVDTKVVRKMQQMLGRNYCGESEQLELFTKVFEGQDSALKKRLVQKTGLTTGLTQGEILLSDSVALNTHGRMRDGVFVQALRYVDGRPFAMQGDSGALVWDIDHYINKETGVFSAYGIVHKVQNAPFRYDGIEYGSFTYCVRLSNCLEALRQRYGYGLKYHSLQELGTMKPYLPLKTAEAEVYIVVQ